MTVGREHNERLTTLKNLKRQTETSGTHADILPDLRVIQYLCVVHRTSLVHTAAE
jgi:hypothetical protein